MRKLVPSGLAVLAVVWGAACTHRLDHEASPRSVMNQPAPVQLPPRGSLEYLDAESQRGVLAFGKPPPDWLKPTGDKIFGVPVYAREASSEKSPQDVVTTFAYDPKWGLVAVAQVVPTNACMGLYQKMLENYGPPTEGEWPAMRAVEWKGRVTRLRLERQGDGDDADCATARLWRKWLDRPQNVPPLYGD